MAETLACKTRPRAPHIKRRIDHALGAALAKGGHDCEVFVSGPKVQIDAATAFEPDVVVSCAEVPDGLLVPDPLIVVEVLSTSTRDKDFTVKLAGYAGLAERRPLSADRHPAPPGRTPPPVARRAGLPDLDRPQRHPAPRSPRG